MFEHRVLSLFKKKKGREKKDGKWGEREKENNLQQAFAI